MAFAELQYKCRPEILHLYGEICDPQIELKVMKVHYQIKSEETGTVLLRQRKVAKALRRWLRQNGFSFQYDYFIPRSYYFYRSKNS